MKKSLILNLNIALGLMLFLSFHGFSQSESLSKDDLAKLNRELDNPLAKYWSLVFQENLSVNNGDLVENGVISNTVFFQPALPIPFGNNLVFTARPVFPLVTQPNFSTDPSGSKKITGFGDIQMAALIGPGNASGWVWGVGATFVFPTASNFNLGQGKYQIGPTAMIFHLGEKWNKGVFIQHWWSYAGHEDRSEVVTTDIQYVIRKNLKKASIGMGPSIRIDWTKGFKDGITIPIGLGYTQTVLMGKTPVKMRLEPQYSIVRPDNYGNVWNVRLQIAPIIKSPFLD
ncbi:transporter family protein [Cognatitamlana onchidii]|uniref:hypothetical protein n=1 Tax=Cognatitamlana onchidii TaxID=2562860 RepID=UPI0010A616D9|nr:hypothetical protein [Algibacter onchidii]